VILVDTGPIVAAASKRDEHHATCLAALSSVQGPPLITPHVVMEVCYFLSTRATMEGFGVHTFRLVNDKRETALVQFHWKPTLGVHSLTWEEAQIAAGVGPDFHRSDLADAIEAGV